MVSRMFSESIPRIVKLWIQKDTIRHHQYLSLTSSEKSQNDSAIARNTLTNGFSHKFKSTLEPRFF